MFEASVERMDARVTLQTINACTRQQMQAECSVLELAAHFADQHPGETLTGGAVAGQVGRLSKHVTEQALQLGGEGTPLVAEFALADLAVAIEDTTSRARTIMAAALDLRHRLPLLWQRVCDGNIRAWMAIKVAEATHTLTTPAAQQIDHQIVDQISTLRWPRFEESLRAKVIATDPERAQRLVRRAKDELYVSISKDARWGTRTIRARLTADDATRLDATLGKLGTIIAETEPTILDDGHAQHQLHRAKALGRLGNPLHALRTLAEEAQPNLFRDDQHEALDWLRTVEPRKLLPRATLHVHISRDSLNDTADDAVARVEGIGPIIGSQIKEWLQTTRLTVRPVVDLAKVRPVDAYEVPPTMRAALYDRTPASCFPWSNRTGRHLDIDHTLPYRRSGAPPPRPPGQTGLHNLGPLSRSEHRLKTHGHWSVRQPEPGTYVWRTRHGRVLIVNDTGTHDLGDRTLADTLWRAVSGQDRGLTATAG